MRDEDWVSASKIGSVKYCPHSVYLDCQGQKVSSSAKAARERGDVLHDQLNEKAEDTRCFIASHLFGPNDPRTILLRRFRDDHLLRSRIGRSFVDAYYRLSPFFVRIAKSNYAVDRFLYFCTKCVLMLVGRK